MERKPRQPIRVVANAINGVDIRVTHKESILSSSEARELELAIREVRLGKKAEVAVSI